MRFEIGTSGFSYEEWKGSFYPSDLPKTGMLAFYAERFQSVEINNTFYRMPRASMLEGWAEQVPAAFSFALKVSRMITHRKRLAGAGDDVAFLWDRAQVLGEQLGPFLVQLPPYLKRDDDLLRDFFDVWPEGVRLAVEFRHPSWFDDAVYRILEDRGDTALVVSDRGGADPPPVVGTTTFGYARLRREEYDDAALDAWIETFRREKWERCWVFFKHEESGRGPALGARFHSRSLA